MDIAKSTIASFDFLCLGSSLVCVPRQVVPFDFSTLVCGSLGQPCLDQISTGDPASRQPHVVHQPEASESHQSPLSRISSSSPNHLRINHFGNHYNPQAAPSQVTFYPVRNISRSALAKSEKLIEVSSCLSKYCLVYRSIFLFIEVSSCWQR